MIECPVDGVIKKTMGYVAQVFNANGICIGQEFIVDTEGVMYETPNETKNLVVNDPRQRFYHPFMMVEPNDTCKGFTCPKCGDKGLEEVMTDVTMTTKILEVDGEIFYGEINGAGDSGEVDRYQCAGCGYVIAHSDTELFEVFGK